MSHSQYPAYSPPWLIIAGATALAWQVLIIALFGPYASEFEQALREHAGPEHWPQVTALYFETYGYWWLITSANALALLLAWARPCSQVIAVATLIITIVLSLAAQVVAIKGLLAPFTPVGKLLTG